MIIWPNYRQSFFLCFSVVSPSVPSCCLLCALSSAPHLSTHPLSRFRSHTRSALLCPINVATSVNNRYRSRALSSSTFASPSVIPIHALLLRSSICVLWVVGMVVRCAVALSRCREFVPSSMSW
ncbi:hypothetical protein C8Q74DRAFT_719806 [Fomes fomentarius]|nr:hypothetical protein C8Q74DRAFT_719806 [Fomes fomentarius]